MAGVQVPDLKLREDYEALVLELRGMDPENALRAIDDFERRNANRDTDGWLRRTVLTHRALVLRSSGDLEAAVEVYRKRLALGFSDGGLAASHFAGLGAVLLRLGRFVEAEAVVAEGFEEVRTSVPPFRGGGGLVSVAVELLDTGRPVPDYWAEYARSIALSYGVSVVPSGTPETTLRAASASIRSRPGRTWSRS